MLYQITEISGYNIVKNIGPYNKIGPYNITAHQLSQL